MPDDKVQSNLAAGNKVMSQGRDMTSKALQDQLAMWQQRYAAMPSTAGMNKEMAKLVDEQKKEIAGRISELTNSLAQSQRMPLPEYKIPDAVGEAMNMYKDMSKQGLPGERLIEDKMGAAVAGSVGDINRVADSSAGALGAVSGLYGRYMDSVRDLGIQSANVKRENQLNYAGAKVDIEAPYTDKAWEYNFNIPYQRGENMYWNLSQDATKNLYGMTDSINAESIQRENARKDRQMQFFQGITSLLNPLNLLSGLGGGESTQSNGYNSTSTIPAPQATPMPYQNVGGYGSSFFNNVTIPPR